LAEERGLKLIQRVPFHIYYEKAVRTDPEAVQLLRRMKVIENGGSRLSDDEWEAAGKQVASMCKQLCQYDLLTLNKVSI
jgi:hypothetical protein